METGAAIKDQAEKLSTDEWIDLIGSSLVERRFLGDLPLPGAPSAVLQAAFVGSHVPFGCFVRSTTRPPLPFRDQFSLAQAAFVLRRRS